MGPITNGLSIHSLVQLYSKSNDHVYAQDRVLLLSIPRFDPDLLPGCTFVCFCLSSFRADFEIMPSIIFQECARCEHHFNWYKCNIFVSPNGISKLQPFLL